MSVARDGRTCDWLRCRLSSLGLPPGSVPLLGSVEFDRLPELDRARFAAVIRAAAAWWREGLPEVIAERIRDELAVVAQIEQADFEAVAARVRAMASQPTFAELRRRWTT